MIGDTPGPVDTLRSHRRPATLRDQFAMAAVPALIIAWKDVDGKAEEVRLDMATEAYAIADAMLIVRAR